MPYFYSLTWTNHRTGLLLARPLFFTDPTHDRLREYTDAYLLGESLLVAPVLDEGKRSKSVRVPEGRWIDCWTDRVYDGGRTVTVDTLSIAFHSL